MAIDKMVQLPKKVAKLLKQAVTLLRRGDNEGAQKIYKEVLSIYPNLPDAQNVLGSILGELGRPEEGLEWINKAIKAKPRDPSFHNNLAVLHRKSGDLSASELSFRTAIKISPKYRPAWIGIAECLGKAGRISEALEAYEQALTIDPADAAAWNNMGMEYSTIGDVENALFSFQTASRISGDPLLLISNVLFGKNYDHRLSLDEMFRLHIDAAKRIESGVQPMPRGAGQATNGIRRLRIGFVSGDFKTHPVGFFFESVLKNLDRELFQINLYPTTAYCDDVTERMKSFGDGWKCLPPLDDDAAAQLVADDRNDVLFDLSGHTAENRLGVFARRPAPIQVSWLGYYATTGLSAIDYIFVDPHLCRPEWQRYFSEKLVFLPLTRLCFTPPTDVLAVSSLPALQGRGVTFGCFNNLAKLNDDVFDLWARLLCAVPNSRLLLKARGLSDPPTCKRILDYFEGKGVAAERLIFEAWSERKENFEAHNRVDIMLDPFPFSGATTSVESLWMGVPFLTLRGDSLVSCQGVSILKNIGLDDWIADTKDAYIACAVKQTQSLERLANLRSGLRERLLKSPICDAKLFANDFAETIQCLISAAR